MKWSKEDCPYCNKDDYKVVESTMSGGYKRVKCDHIMPTKIITDEIASLKALCVDVNDRITELRLNLRKGLKEVSSLTQNLKY